MFNNPINKFFDIDAPAPAAPTEQQSIAALMARQGVKSDPGSDVEIPRISMPIHTEKKEESPTVKEPPAAMATAPEAEKANPEPPKPVEPAQVPVQKEQEQSKVQSWQEVLKSQQPNTVLKELLGDDKLVGLVSEMKELDPKVVGLIQAYKNGTATDYLRELTTDYSKMSPEDLMRHQLRRDYPTATPQQLDALFKREVIKAYSLDSDDEAEAAEGKLLLEAKADRVRDEMTKNQQNYLLPKPPEPKAVVPDNTEQLRQQEYDLYKSYVMDDQYTKSLVSGNKMVIGDGEDAFKFPIASSDVVDIMLDSDSFAKGFFKAEIRPDGSKVAIPDGKKLGFVATYLKYGDDFLNAFAEHYKTLGSRSAIAPIENAKQPDGSTPSKTEAEPTSPAAAMARYGRKV